MNKFLIGGWCTRLPARNVKRGSVALHLLAGAAGGVIQQSTASAHPSLSQPGCSGKGSGTDAHGGRRQRSPFKPERPISFQSSRQGRGEPQPGDASLRSESTDIRYLHTNVPELSGDGQLRPRALVMRHREFLTSSRPDIDPSP